MKTLRPITSAHTDRALRTSTFAAQVLSFGTLALTALLLPSPAWGEGPPVITESTKLLADIRFSTDEFGGAVDLYGRNLLVGASSASDCEGCSSSGKAYLYRKEGESWNPISVLVGSDVGLGHSFGASVALVGDLAFVGSPEPGGGHLAELGQEARGVSEGSVYVFDGGVEVAKLKASNGDFNDNFGREIAASAGRLFVGVRHAEHPDGGARDAGAVYVFEQGEGPGDWTEVQQLGIPIEPKENFEFFGYAVAASETTLMATSVGANIDFDLGWPVWVFELEGDEWVYKTMITVANDRNSRFGEALAIDGDRAIAGAMLADSNIPGNNGAAYIIERDDAGEWGLVAKLQTRRDDVRRFGIDVAIQGDIAVVGARAQDERGAAFVYRRGTGDDASWEEIAFLVASDGEEEDRLGDSVAISGRTVALGAPLNDESCDGQPSCTRTGSVYLFGD